MICLAYFSSATTIMSADILQGIVAQAQRNNALKGVTGMLCHYDGSFLQFLEGDEAAVSEIYAAICRDPRHTGLMEVYRGEISERIFGEWTMAVVKADDVGPAQQAFARSLRKVQLAGAAQHRQAIEPFLDSFRIWIR